MHNNRRKGSKFLWHNDSTHLWSKNFLFGAFPAIWDKGIAWAVWTVPSFIHQPALLLSSSHYYDIISCLSSILLSGLLSVRYRGVSAMTHIHAQKKKQYRSAMFQKDNYIISAWRASRKVIIRQVFLPIKVSSLVLFFPVWYRARALPCMTFALRRRVNTLMNRTRSKLIAKYFDNQFIAIFQTGAGSSLLNLRICCLTFSFTNTSEDSLGFGLLVGQRKLLKG